jgi:hypothetical protein
MATEAQRARRRAQRATAARVRNKTTILPRSFTKPSRLAQERYANDVIAGREPAPQEMSPEAKQLARMASLASWGKADPRFEIAFAQYWYHDKDAPPTDDEEEEYDDYDEEDEEE